MAVDRGCTGFCFLLMGFAAVSMAAMIVWFHSVNYTTTDCSMVGCMLAQPRNCHCHTDYDQSGGKIKICQTCYDIQCLANITHEENGLRKYYIHGEWGNTSDASQAVQDMAKINSCCVTDYDTRHAFSDSHCKMAKTRNIVFIALTIFFGAIFAMILIYYIYTGSSESDFTHENVNQFSPCCDFGYNLYCTSLDYLSCCAISGAFTFGLTLFAAMLAGAICWGTANHSIINTTAYMSGCFVTPQMNDSTPILSYGVQCNAEFYNSKIHRNVTAIFNTGSFWSYPTAAMQLLQIENNTQEVHYWKNYDSIPTNKTNHHYHRVFDYTDPDVFANHQKQMAGKIMCLFGVSLLVGFAILRECWRQKLIHDVQRIPDPIIRHESQPLISPAANSPSSSSFNSSFSPYPSSSPSASSFSTVPQWQRERDEVMSRKNGQRLGEREKEEEKDRKRKQEEAARLARIKEQEISSQHTGPSYTNRSTYNEERKPYYNGPSYTTTQTTSINDANDNDDDESGESVLCAICTERKKNTALNCGHTLCRTCSLQVMDCPFCKVHIISRNKIFL